MAQSGNIKITPGDMKTSAGKFQSAETETMALVNKLDGEVQRLDATWEGMAKTRFSAEWPGYKKTMLAMKEVLGQVSQSLTKTANAIEAADQASANAISRG